MLCFYIHSHLPEIKLIHTLEKRYADTGPANEHLALFLNTGNYVCLIGRGLDIAQQEGNDYYKHSHDSGKQG